MKIFNDPIGKRVRDLPACSAVPQTTAIPRGPFKDCTSQNLKKKHPSIEDFRHLVCQFIHSLSAGTLMPPVPWKVL